MTKCKLGTCVQAAAVNTDTLIIVVLVHGGPLDISWLEKSDRISGILSAWYPGQVTTFCQPSTPARSSHLAYCPTTPSQPGTPAW